jgi:hypothetical protein
LRIVTQKVPGGKFDPETLGTAWITTGSWLMVLAFNIDKEYDMKYSINKLQFHKSISKS